MPALAWTIRAAKAAKLVDAVWLAIPYNDHELARIAVDNDIRCWCGPELDVLQRYKEAVVVSNADVIVRLTADCPFLDPALIDQCIEYKCSTTENWPDGMDVQVFRRHMLAFGDREHVVSSKWTMPQLKCPEGNLRHVRLTLDTPQDLMDLRWIASRLPTTDRPPTWRETLDTIRCFEVAVRTGKAADPIGEPDVQQGVQQVAEG